MLYLVALILPPLAVLLCGKPFQALINLAIGVLGFVLLVAGVGFFVLPISLIHALFVVHNYYADQRNQRVIRAMREGQGGSGERP
jgi:uncharacterized membrane protein YqaE (UPF0057 family)